MRGTIIAYYIYLVIAVIALLTAVGAIGTGAFAGGIGAAVAIAIGMLPGLLFVGWMAYVLKGCVDIQKEKGV